MVYDAAKTQLFLAGMMRNLLKRDCLPRPLSGITVCVGDEDSTCKIIDASINIKLIPATFYVISIQTVRRSK